MPGDLPHSPKRGDDLHHPPVSDQASIYVFGGESQARSKTLAGVYGLAPGASRWTRVSAMPTARNYARAVPFRSALYVVGGSRTAGDSHGAAGSALVDRFAP